MAKGLPYVAEIFASKGYNIKTYPQIWTDRACNSRSRLILADKPEAIELLNNDLISILNAFKVKTAIDTIDGIILWECD